MGRAMPPCWWEKVISNLGISEREISKIEASEELARGVRELIERNADGL
jgi:hypothetical protein